jgi:hypothetical protein
MQIADAIVVVAATRISRLRKKLDWEMPARSARPLAFIG